MSNVKCSVCDNICDSSFIACNVCGNALNTGKMPSEAQAPSGFSSQQTNPVQTGFGQPNQANVQSATIPESNALGFNSSPNMGFNAAPTSGFNAAPTSGFNAAPTSGFNAAPTSGFNAAPTLGFNAAPASGFNSAPVSGFTTTPASGFNATPASGFADTPSGLTQGEAKNVGFQPQFGINSQVPSVFDNQPTTESGAFTQATFNPDSQESGIFTQTTGNDAAKQGFNNAGAESAQKFSSIFEQTAPPSFSAAPPNNDFKGVTPETARFAEALGGALNNTDSVFWKFSDCLIFMLKMLIPIYGLVVMISCAIGNPRVYPVVITNYMRASLVLSAVLSVLGGIISVLIPIIIANALKGAF